MSLQSTYTYQELSRGLKVLDIAVFQGIYKDFFPMVRKLVMHNSGKAGDAKQVFSEIFSILYGMANQDQLNLECSQGAFIYELAKQIWAYKMQKAGQKLQMPNDTENFRETIRGIELVLAAHKQNSIIRNIYSELEHKDQKYLEWFFGFSPPPLNINDDPAFEATMLKSYYLFDHKIKNDWAFIFKGKSSEIPLDQESLIQIYQYFNEEHPGFSGQGVREKAILDAGFGMLLDMNQSIRNALMLDLSNFTSLVKAVLGPGKSRLGFGLSKSTKGSLASSIPIPGNGEGNILPEISGAAPSTFPSYPKTEFTPTASTAEAEYIPAGEQKKGFSSNLIPYIVIGAIAILLGVVLASFPIRNRSHNPEALFRANFTPYPEVFVPESQGTSPSIRQAMEFYREEKFEKAIPSLMASMSETTPDTIAVLAFYQGISYLAEGEAAKSIEILTPVAESDHPTLGIPAYWYIGLSYLKMGQYASATTALEQVTQSDGKHAIFQKKAQRLITTLSK